MKLKPNLVLIVLLAFCWAPSPSLAQDRPEPKAPAIVEASDEGGFALNAFKIADGINGSLFAAEPLFANPVAFYVDDKGRVLVCETFRQDIGVVDNRDFNQAWVDADLASQSVEDRRQYHLNQLTPERIKRFMEEDDQIRIVVDTNGDGVADDSYVFANGFNDLVDGTGAGILEYRGNIYYTCIPSLYLMRDEDGDNKADGRTALHTGYGARVAFRGHDLHGLVIGPDGRLYFSIGDRGANIETPSGRVKNVESGSVFRCELDGSNLELFATGLRNPQELAFDNHGNLFTGDNNSDSGDQARWVYLVEDSDAGWRMAYQYLADRGPFNREGTWKPQHDGQPAFIVPPIANISDGPSGLDFYPGSGFGNRFDDHFFLADFRGTASKSGIRAIRNEPDGAFFKIAEDSQPFWEILATDFQFGPDGAIYISDWVNGWAGEGKGRIYRFTSEAHSQDEVVKQVREFLASDIAEVASADLRSHLSHPDRRVRLKSQLELATRGEAKLLLDAANAGQTTIEKLHGIWGLDHLSRINKGPSKETLAAWLGLAKSEDAEIRAHAVRLLGEFITDSAKPAGIVAEALKDENPRVRYCALVSARKLRLRNSFEQIVSMIAENAGQDPILRHGEAMALTGVAQPKQLVGLKSHDSKHVRIAAVVALRRLQSKMVKEFLADTDEQVIAEAARAINDAPIDTAMQDLAVLISNTSENPVIVRRVLNANYRVGKADNAAALSAFAADQSNAFDMRLEALEMLANWETPGSRDRVTGMWRPISPRSLESASDAFASVLPQFESAEDEVRLKAGQVASIYKLESAAGILRSIFLNKQFSAVDRAQALVSLANLKAASEEDLTVALNSDKVTLRAAALPLLPSIMPERSLDLLFKAATKGETGEQQTAIKTLGSTGKTSAQAIEVLQRWVAGKLPPEVSLEALEAAENLSDSPDVAKLLAEANADRDESSPVSVYREAMFGGNPELGSKVFWEKVSVSCVRCHKIGGDGGEVGPELTRIGVDKDRRYLLEAIVDPNKVIAKGFESALLLDIDDNVHTGVVREEDDDSITLVDAQGGVTKFLKDDIVARNPALSGMPADLVKNLSKQELRDLVAYLASLDGSAADNGENEVQ
ncbi:MAG: PVC-type heme-binding CxxCH protein [Aureliella sp.]